MTAQGLPHDFDHEHADVSGGWLRAATFGAMDGLVSNTALIAGVAASASAQAVAPRAHFDCFMRRSPGSFAQPPMRLPAH